MTVAAMFIFQSMGRIRGPVLRNRRRQISDQTKMSDTAVNTKRSFIAHGALMSAAKIVCRQITRVCFAAIYSAPRSRADLLIDEQIGTDDALFSFTFA